MTKLLAIVLFVPVVLVRCIVACGPAMKKAAADEWRGFLRTITGNPYRF
jgi:hypothetical protein